MTKDDEPIRPAAPPQQCAGGRRRSDGLFRESANGAERVRNPVNSEVIFCAAGVLSPKPLTAPSAAMTANWRCSASPSLRTRRRLPGASVVSHSERERYGSAAAASLWGGLRQISAGVLDA
jgi:hypothetical protein